jgi:4-hydroxy-L-threonine phosphate dehydrogenase PdxA
MGDAAGVGPEVIMKALAHPERAAARSSSAMPGGSSARARSSALG